MRFQPTIAILAVAVIFATAAVAVEPTDKDTCVWVLDAFAEGSWSEDAAYNAACCMALYGSADDAFQTLAIAMERGYRDADLMAEDVDLEPLHEDPRWASILEECRAAQELFLSTINADLYAIFLADQEDRHGDIDWTVVAPRDQARREQTRALIDADQLQVADDFVHAAFVFQHGTTPEDFKTAHELAMKAVELRPDYMRARWIAAASKDRYLLHIGKKQIYGTQYEKVDGEWVLSPIDSSAVTDEERKRWGARPLAAD